MGMQETLRAMADPTRREIMYMLKKGRLSAGEISSRFPVTAACISRHLSVLKEADLIRDTREGKYIFYELNASVLEEVMLWITALKGDMEDEQAKQETADPVLGGDAAADADRADPVEPSARTNGDTLGSVGAG